MFSTKLLKRHFAHNLQTPLFVMLADLYYHKRQFKQAERVCRIGLDYDKNNTEGQYILAKTLLVRGKNMSSEKLLKKILLYNPYHLNALILLISLLEALGRSSKTIKKYLLFGLPVFQNNQILLEYYNKYCGRSLSRPRASQNQNLKKNKHISEPLFLLNNKLATKTLYKLLFKQKKYKNAFTILRILEEQKKNTSFIKKEMQIIKNILGEK